MTFVSTSRESVRLPLLATAMLLSASTAAIAKNNDGSATACNSELSPRDFVECLCDEEGGIFWETDTEFGCWQLEIGEFDYRCMKGQPLSSCIVTLPAVDPPDEQPEKRPITGAISGGPGGGEAASVDPTDSGPSAIELETVQQSGAPNLFAAYDAQASDNEADLFRASSEDSSNINDAVDDSQVESDDNSAADDSTETADTDDEANAMADSTAAPQLQELVLQDSGPCGAGAASATVMLIAGLSLISGRGKVA